MPDEELEFPYPICEKNMKGIGRIEGKLEKLEKKVMNHLSDLKKGNGMSMAQRVALYTILIEAISRVIIAVLT